MGGFFGWWEDTLLLTRLHTFSLGCRYKCSLLCSCREPYSQSWYGARCHLQVVEICYYFHLIRSTMHEHQLPLGIFRDISITPIMNIRTMQIFMHDGVIKSVWFEIHEHLCRKLVHSMPAWLNQGVQQGQLRDLIQSTDSQDLVTL